MNWWEILEISRDSDLKAIKRAYAKLLKIHNPEDDAEGYQRLREAYDKAIKYAKNNKKEKVQDNLSYDINDEGNNIEVDNLKSKVDIDEEIIVRNEKYSNNIYEKSNNENHVQNEIEEFLTKVNEIYEDDSLRKDIKAWEELLSKDVVWNVYSSSIIEDYMFEFLINHKDLPLSVWYILDYHFHWTKKERDIYKNYDEEDAQEIFETLKRINTLKYEHIRKINPEVIEEYLSLRKDGEKALKKREWYEAQLFLISAYNLFDGDNELLNLIGFYYNRVRDLENSMKFYKLAFQLDSSNLDTNLWLGNNLLVMGRFEEALTYVEAYLFANSEAEDALNMGGYCYYFIGDLIKAKECFEKLSKINPKNRFVKKYLNNIEAKLKGKKVKTLKPTKYRIRKKKIVKKEEREKASKRRKTIIKSVFFIMVVAFVLKLGVNLVTSFNNEKPEKVVEKQKKEIKRPEIENEDESIFKTIRFIDDFRGINNCINVRIYLDSVESTDFYKMSEKVNGKFILPKSEVEAKNLQNKIESRVYVGTFAKGIILFADKNYNEDSKNEKYAYKIEGAMCPLVDGTFEDIKAQYEIKNKSDKDWRIGLYIDPSPQEVAKIKSRKIRNGVEVKVVETLKEFKESGNGPIYEIYLKNIRPLNMYAYADDNGKFSFCKKEELSKKSSEDKVYNQAFVGEIDGKNVMFINDKFSIDKIDNNKGYAVQGYTYEIAGDKEINLPLEDGQESKLVNIEMKFIYNNHSKIVRRRITF